LAALLAALVSWACGGDRPFWAITAAGVIVQPNLLLTWRKAPPRALGALVGVWLYALIAPVAQIDLIVAVVFEAPAPHIRGSPTMTTVPLARIGHRRSEVGPVELFFDLVYVFAIIQLSHLLIKHLSWEGAAQTIVVFAAVWWGWNYTAWAMNWLDPSRTPVQLLSGVLMLAALGMSIAIPSAFGDGAWLFVGCYLFMGLLRPMFMMITYRGHQLAANYRMLLLWTLLAGMFWVLGAALPLEWRLGLWLIAVLIDYAAPLAHYRIPGIGAAPMHQWDTDAEHLAERNRLVFIIALGESILLMGGSIVSHGQLTPGLALSLIVGFASL